MVKILNMRLVVNFDRFDEGGNVPECGEVLGLCGLFKYDLHQTFALNTNCGLVVILNFPMFRSYITTHRRRARSATSLTRVCVLWRRHQELSITPQFHVKLTLVNFLFIYVQTLNVSTSFCA